jgi:hypothetical protein
MDNINEKGEAKQHNFEKLKQICQKLNEWAEANDESYVTTLASEMEDEITNLDVPPGQGPGNPPGH